MWVGKITWTREGEMFHMVNKKQVSIIEGPEGQSELFAEASSLGLAPGEWPEFIAVMHNESKDAAEGFLFQRAESIKAGEEFGGFNYRSRTGAFTLAVLND